MPAPKFLSDLVSVVVPLIASIPTNPSPSDMIDFWVACNAHFTAEYGHDTDINTSNRLFQTLAYIAPMFDMNGARDALKQMEEQYRILDASEISAAFNRRYNTDRALNLEPLEKLVFSPHKYHTTQRDASTYGQHIPNNLRGAVVMAAVRLGCIFSTIWGCFIAHEDSTMTILYDLIQRIGSDDLPSTPDLQKSPTCARTGLILGWNCAMEAVNDTLTDRFRTSPSSALSMHQLIGLMQAATRAALVRTATSFCTSLPQSEWKWRNGITFDLLCDSFDNAFQHIIAQVAPVSDDDAALHFSLRMETVSISAESNSFDASNTEPDTTDTASGDGEPKKPTDILNLPPNAYTVLGLQRPQKRRRINMGAPPHNSNPPQNNTDASDNPPDTLTPAQIEANNRRETIDRERRAINARIATRQRNRANNAHVTPGEIWERGHQHLRMLRDYVGGTNEVFRFEDYNPDSDNDEIAHVNETDASRKNDIEERVEVEVFFLECLGHRLEVNIQPSSESEDSIFFDCDSDFNHYIASLLAKCREMFRVEVTRCENAFAYSEHLKALLHLDKHFMMQKALFETFPEAVNDRTLFHLLHPLNNSRNTSRYVVTVDSIGNSRTLTHLVCSPYSVSHNVRRSMIRQFPGLTACVGVVWRGKRSRNTRNGQRSAVSFVMCRSISHDHTETEAVDAENDPLLHNIVMNLTVPRHWFDQFRIAQGDVVHLIPFCTLVTSLRELKSIHAVENLPKKLQDVLFGSPYATHPGALPNVAFPRTRNEYEASLEALADIRDRVDPGCLAYVDSLQGNNCDESQRRALLTTLGECGEMLPNSSSLSMIIGPPGCGKSHTIALLAMALMHHSRVGHCRPGATNPTVLPKPQERLRYSDNVEGCRVLVTCSSNYGADQVAMKLSQALPMGDGSLMHPLVVRIGRTDYDYKELEPISLHRLALEYDVQVYNLPQEGGQQRRWASTEALRALLNESVILVCTNATAAGPMLQSLNVAVSAVFIDEAGHSSEMETLMPIMANVAMAQEGRVHVVLVGDPKQLGPVFLCHHDAVSFVTKNRWFRTGFGMLRQFESMMERLFRTNRCKVSWLTHHYRSHPSMARVTTAYIYNDLLTFPRPAEQFDAPYNNVGGDRGLQVITIIDTRLSKERWESSMAGSSRGREMYNLFECRRMNEMLYRIYNNRGGEDLTNQIIVCAPYADQTAMLQARLRSGFLSQRSPGGSLNVAVENIDALQGSEREIALISLTRSNRDRNIGFLTDNGRLNVAFTRSRKLLVIIGDFSTMSASRVAHSIYDMVRRGSPRTRLEFHRPHSRREVDQYQENVMNRLRHRR